MTALTVALVALAVLAGVRGMGRSMAWRTRAWERAAGRRGWVR